MILAKVRFGDWFDRVTSTSVALPAMTDPSFDCGCEACGDGVVVLEVGVENVLQPSGVALVPVYRHVCIRCGYSCGVSACH